MKNTSNPNPYLTNLLMTTALYLFFFVIPSNCDSPPPYTPIDNIAIDCGSSGNSTAVDGRVWVGDIGLKLTLAGQLNNGSITLSAQNQSTTMKTVPYFTARIFPTEFTFLFSVTAGPKFIRLHFYPSLYQQFDSSKALFSVKANGFMLLRNFSAFLTAESLGADTIAKEYCINIEDDEILNITFIPSMSTSNDWFAFINAIEVISMPTNLYHSCFGTPLFNFIGQNNPFRVQNKTALESVYRLNVGGRKIPAMQDPIFRSWWNDDIYCSYMGALPINTSIKLKFTKTPNYTAPPDLYRTARSMGNNKTINYSYNLTWNLPVDSGFEYMVRLHFCEFQSEVTKPHDRQFHIFIANQTADAYADVIVWSGGNGVPFYRDYVVFVEHQENQNKKNLSIALHPNSESATRYSDAILNGIELFKLSDSVGNLAGGADNTPNRDPPAKPKSNQTPAKPKSNQTSKLIAGIIGGVVILSIIAFLIFRQLKRKDSILSNEAASWWNPFSFAASKPTKADSSSLLSSLCRHFSLAEIKRATDNFDDGFIIGYGGFGDVYKGYIDGGATPVAIKRLKQGSQQGAQEFKTEIELLSQLRHQHLVSLIGYCNEREMILVYDYMACGTLCDHLYNTNNPPLSWKQRLEICIGAAHGLNYLHTGEQHRIIHRDVKTANILLDENWVAKVSDFGLSKSYKSRSRTHISTNVKGTFGYLDPEYYWTQRLTEKSDVFAFGVVLLEVLCGRPAVDLGLEEEQHSLCQWARHCINTGKLDQIIDPCLVGKITPDCLSVFVEIANKCLLGSRVERPTMAGVVESLELALELQESVDGDADEPMKLAGTRKDRLGWSQIQMGGALAHSRSTSLQESISHKLLVRFFSDNGGLNWPKQSTFYGPNTFSLPVDDLE